MQSKMSFYSCDCKVECSTAIAPVFSVLNISPTINRAINKLNKLFAFLSVFEPEFECS